MLTPTGKTQSADDEKLAIQTHAFSPYSSSRWLEPMGHFTSKPLGLESAFLSEKVVLGDGYQVKPIWRRCGQN